jgi:hypothetical protein
MIHPDTELQYISNEIGYGVVAKNLIPKGTITWVLDKIDREFSPMDIIELDDIYKEILDIYTFRNNKGNHVLCWDNGRYVNHSFNSNCLTTAYDFEIAIRDIQPGEQLTDDYGYLNLTAPFRPLPEGTRRKVVYPDDLVKYAKIWDKKLLPAFHKITAVEQPLKKLISDEMWRKIHTITTGKEEMASILNCYYDGNGNGYSHQELRESEKA